MDQRTLMALCRILDYLLAIEEKHYEEAGEPKKHIYLDVLQVRRWAITKLLTRSGI